MSIRLIDLASAIQMPWKNGSGSTIELAIEPAGANLDNFAWRISSADVGCDGSFSNFPGIDRSLAILSGAGLRLNSAKAPAHSLTCASQPWAFAGETTVYAELLDGAVTDLNIMTRRKFWAHQLDVIEVDGEYHLDNSKPAAVVLIYNHAASRLNCTLSSGEQHQIGPRQGLLLSDDHAGQAITLSAPAASNIYVARLTRTTDTR